LIICVKIVYETDSARLVIFVWALCYQ